MDMSTDVIDTLRSEIASFARAGTPVEITERKPTEISIKWQFHKDSRETRFRWRASARSWIVLDSRVSNDWISYKNYLASEHMADLRYLAQQITLNIKIPDNYLPTTITRSDEEGNALQPQEAMECLNEQVAKANGDDASDTRTQVLFLRGEAGTGKSVALRKFAVEQARQYLLGASLSVCLYIDAQGKALLNIHDAFSSTLDDLSIGNIRKDTIAVLCRHGLLVPLIDGFDELLGSGGYGEAFNSLSAFIAGLQRQGILITSGRSAFYDDQYLQIGSSQLSTGNLDYHTVVATIDPWSEAEIRSYCQRAWEGREDKEKLLSNLSRLLAKSVVFHLLRKPFFTAQVADLIPSGGFDADRLLVEQLVDGLLNREKDKWKTTEGTQILSMQDHYRFLQDVAEEMWWQRTLELDTDTIRLLAETSTGQLSSSAKNLVVNRSTTHAAFESERKNQVFLHFQHAIYFDFFLQRKLLELLERSDEGSMLSFLERGLLTESTLELLSQTSRDFDTKKITSMIHNCCKAMRPESRYQSARQNVGAIVAAFLNDRESIFQGLELNWLIFRKINLNRVTVQDSTIQHCEFDNAKMYAFVAENVKFKECWFESVVFNYETHIVVPFDQLGVVGTVIFVDEKHTSRRVLIPSEKANILAKIGVIMPPENIISDLSKPQKDTIELLDRFLRRMERNYYLSPELEKTWGYTNLPGWPELKALLIKHRLLVSRSLQKNGPVGALDILSRVPQKIRQGLEYKTCPDERIAGFWKELLGTF